LTLSIRFPLTGTLSCFFRQGYPLPASPMNVASNAQGVRQCKAMLRSKNHCVSVIRFIFGSIRQFSRLSARLRCVAQTVPIDEARIERDGWLLAHMTSQRAGHWWAWVERAVQVTTAWVVTPGIPHTHHRSTPIAQLDRHFSG
jgi:hypothetical protein